jgi:CheY-like chemotaxis protein
MTDEPVRILLVEDNAADRYLFRKALLSAGINFHLIVFEDGGTAMEFVRGEGQFAESVIPSVGFPKAIVERTVRPNCRISVTSVPVRQLLLRTRFGARMHAIG